MKDIISKVKKDELLYDFDKETQKQIETMNKQTTIQAEWIEIGFEPCNFDENGYVDFDLLPDNFNTYLCEVKTIGNNVMVRPKSLQGIENNNGWIKINSEDDLPKEDCNCHIEYKDGAIEIAKFYKRYNNFNIVHYKYLIAYRPINEPPKRIY